MKKPLLLFMITLMLSSCQSTMLRLVGLRTPKVESKASIFKFLQKIHVDTNDVYGFDSNLFSKSKTLPFKPGWKPGFRPIQIRCYNSTGKPVMQWASCEGFLKELKIFDSIPPKNINGLDTMLNLSNDLGQYFTLDGTLAQIRPDIGYDFYFLVFFAKYFPGMSRESFSQISGYALKHQELRMKVYKINVDVQEFWGEEIKIDTEVY